MPQFELRLDTGAVVVWSGADGVAAARRYVDTHRDRTVVAYRGRPNNPSVLGRQKITHAGD